MNERGMGNSNPLDECGDELIDEPNIDPWEMDIEFVFVGGVSNPPPVADGEFGWDIDWLMKLEKIGDAGDAELMFNAGGLRREGIDLTIGPQVMPARLCAASCLRSVQGKGVT